MYYPSYRYRAALRRARRYHRYRRNGLAGWQKVVLGLIAVALFGGGGTTAVHTITKALTSAAVAASATAPSAQAQAAISFARARIGCPYLFGGTGPCAAGYDCSGLVMEAYAAAGVTIPRTTFQQWDGLRHVTSPHRGDLVFFAGSDGTPSSPGHVGLVLGPDRMIEAYATGFPVRVSTFGLPSSPQGDTIPVGFARPVPLAHTATLTAASSYTPATWAQALLRGAGYQPVGCNLAAVLAWQNAEGDWTHGHATWHNPLNDTRTMPGSTPVNSKNVQSYTSWAQGLTATLATLGGPDYRGIRAALAAGNNAQAVANAVAASPWGTQPFLARC